jgi:biotin transport system substrate-specific component
MGIFAVMLCAVVLPLKLSLAAVLVFLLTGATGLPVFAGFSGGPAQLAGPTGGYLIGYLGLVATAALLERRKGGAPRAAASLIAGMLVCYALGTCWLAAGLGYSFRAAFMTGALPFILPDTAKAIAAAAAGLRLRAALRLHGNGGLRG